MLACVHVYIYVGAHACVVYFYVENWVFLSCFPHYSLRGRVFLSLSLFYNITLYWVFGNFTTCTWILLTPSSFISTPRPCSILPKRTTPKLVKKKTNQTRNPHFAPWSFQRVFIHPSGLGSWGVSRRLPFCPFKLTCKRSLSWVWFKASGTLPSWTLPEIPVIQPAVAPSHGDPVAVIPQDQSLLHALQQVIEGQILGWANPRMWVWVSAELVGLGHWDHRSSLGAEPALSGPCFLDQWGRVSQLNPYFKFCDRLASQLVLKIHCLCPWTWELQAGHMPSWHLDRC